MQTVRQKREIMSNSVRFFFDFLTFSHLSDPGTLVRMRGALNVTIIIRQLVKIMIKSLFKIRFVFSRRKLDNFF